MWPQARWAHDQETFHGPPWATAQSRMGGSRGDNQAVGLATKLISATIFTEAPAGAQPEFCTLLVIGRYGLRRRASDGHQGCSVSPGRTNI